MSPTYSARSAAIRAAHSTLGADRMVGVHFTITETAGRFAWAPINLTTGEVGFPVGGGNEPEFDADDIKAVGEAPAFPDPEEMGVKLACLEDRVREPASGRVSNKYKEALAAAQAGKLPAEPDFSAETHKRFRPKLAEVVALAKAGDVAGLRAFDIKPISTSPKAIDRYRNLAVIALEARA